MNSEQILEDNMYKMCSRSVEQSKMLMVNEIPNKTHRLLVPNKGIESTEDGHHNKGPTYISIFRMQIELRLKNIHHKMAYPIVF